MKTLERAEENHGRDGSYTGGKGSAGVYHRLIRLMPPHRTYVAPFLGHDAILRHKRPAEQSIGIDSDPQVIAWWDRRQNRMPVPNLMLQLGDGPQFLENMAWSFTPATLIYIDPPYRRKSCTRTHYRGKHGSDQSHKRLLMLAVHMPCLVMVSHYPCELYSDMLERQHGWNVEQYKGNTRGGHKDECVWFNFPRPTVLHDLRYAGMDFRERERLKRKGQRYRKKFEGMTATERQIMYEQLADLMPPNPIIETKASASSPAPPTPPPAAASPHGSSIAHYGERIRGAAAAATKQPDEDETMPLFGDAGDLPANGTTPIPGRARRAQRAHPG